MRQISNVILLRGEWLLLGLRAQHRRTYPGCWAVPGGHVEPGEKPEQAAVREIREELGVTITKLYSLSSISVTEINDTVIFHMFASSEWIDGSPSLQSDEHSELRWFSVEEACGLDTLALDEYRASFRSLHVLS